MSPTETLSALEPQNNKPQHSCDYLHLTRSASRAPLIHSRVKLSKTRPRGGGPIKAVDADPKTTQLQRHALHVTFAQQRVPLYYMIRVSISRRHE